jgi:purine-binding chemotaxis protein CheW
MEILVFSLDEGRYALPAADVLEVLPAVAVAPLPQAPRIVEGIVNVRGRIVPVLDVRARFRRAARPLAPEQHLVLARAGERTVALRVDCASELVHVDEAAISDPRAAVPGVGYVAGVAKLAEGIVLIHDIETFLSAAEAAELDSALEPGAAEAPP